MAGHSIPIDFWVDPKKISNPVERDTILEDILPMIKPYFGSLEKVSDGKLPGGHYFCLYASETASLFIKMYQQGLVTTNLEYFVNEDSVNEHKMAIDDGRKIEKNIIEKFGSKKVKFLPALKRAPSLNPYFTSSDDRLLEYDVDEVVFEENSNFQKVQIIHTKSYGNVLFLDDLQNLAESDISYTQGLMNYGKEDFKGKEILILGGGDGALLWELLKEDPAFVTMIDIDEVVLKACREHLRSACGDCLDNYNGKNYKIIIDDAIAYMKKYLAEGRKFDYVFYDLTDVPIAESHGEEEVWVFIRKIISLGIQLLNSTGKFLMHCIGIQCEGTLKTYEEELKKLPVTYTRTSAYVPSFMENWCFYQISLKG